MSRNLSFVLFGSFLDASDSCAVKGCGRVVRAKAGEIDDLTYIIRMVSISVTFLIVLFVGIMNRKQCNTSSVRLRLSTGRKKHNIQPVTSVNNEDNIESWLQESDESSADEDDYIQADRDVSTED